MSASREKQNRQEQNSSGWVDPKTIREEDQRKKEKRNNRLYAIIAVVFLIAVVISVVWRSNVIAKNATAVTIDGEKYTAGEVSFYYQNVYQSFVNNYSYLVSYMGLDTTSSLKTQTISETAASWIGAEAGQTWHDYFLDQALVQMSAVQTALKNAESEGFVYPAGVQAQYDDSMASVEAAAAASGVSVSDYVQNALGAEMTEDIYSEQLMRMLQFDAYATAYDESLVYTDSEINAAYEADRSSYDEVAYEIVGISGMAASTTDADGNTVEPTEEEEAAAMEAAKEAADKMLADFRAGKDLEELAKADEEKYIYSENDGITYSGDVVTEWLFDEARQAGDSAVLEYSSTYYVVVFRERTRNEEPTIDVRHILIQPEAGTLTSSDEGYAEEQAKLMADAVAYAEELLAQWKAGEATEESFAELAMQESTDGSKYVGGLYTQVYQGQMVTAFNDWCFDASRKPGDTDVVETEYGAHVMYFVNENLPYWQMQVVSTLKNADYIEWVDALSSDSSIERHDFGLEFVG